MAISRAGAWSVATAVLIVAISAMCLTFQPVCRVLTLAEWEDMKLTGQFSGYVSVVGYLLPDSTQCVCAVCAVCAYVRMCV
jgi:hypothetical protein